MHLKICKDSRANTIHPVLLSATSNAPLINWEHGLVSPPSVLLLKHLNQKVIASRKEERVHCVPGGFIRR